MKPPEVYLHSVDEVCHILSIKRTKFYELKNSDAFPTYVIGSKRVVRSDDLNDFIRGLPEQSKRSKKKEEEG